MRFQIARRRYLPNCRQGVAATFVHSFQRGSSSKREDQIARRTQRLGHLPQVSEPRGLLQTRQAQSDPLGRPSREGWPARPGTPPISLFQLASVAIPGKGQCYSEYHRWNSLHSPSNSEHCRSRNNPGATIADEVHDEDTPFYGPLLNSDDPASNGAWRKLSEVNTDLTGADSDGQTVDDSSHDELSDVLRRAYNCTADDEDDAGNLQSDFAPKSVCEESSCDCAEK